MVAFCSWNSRPSEKRWCRPCSWLENDYLRAESLFQLLWGTCPFLSPIFLPFDPARGRLGARNWAEQRLVRRGRALP